MFLNGIEQLLRRKIVLTAGIATLVFLGLYWWGVSSVASADLTSGPDDPTMNMLSPADAALAAIITAGPLAATLVTALMVVIGSTMLPEEIAEGRMPFWLSLPQSRLRVFIQLSLAPLAVSYVLSIILFSGILIITKIYFPFDPRNVILVPVFMLLWIAVIWSTVTLLSLVLRKVASMLITFFLAAIASMFGGLYEIIRMFPGTAPEALVTVIRVVMYVFPADRGYRGVLYGMIPGNAVITENLAFFGVFSGVPPVHMLYALFFCIVLMSIGYLKFKKMDY